MHSFEEKLLPEELAILNRLTNHSLNFEAMAVVTNLYRAAQRLRTKMERDVLSKYNISWTAFTLLYNLWIWGSMEPRKLAKSMGVTVAAVSSMTNTLERKQWCKREANLRDRRLVLVTLTDEGKKVIEELYPEFNQGEADVVADLDREEQKILTQLLRRVNKKIEA